MNTIIHPDIFKGKVTGFFTGKEPGADLEEIAAILHIEKKQIYMPVQKHTDKVFPLYMSSEPHIADAVITDRKGVLLGIQVADCVPILLYDPKRHVIAVVHAGWRGTGDAILKKTIESMAEEYSSDAEKMLIAIGPSIGPCCYEVGLEVVQKVSHASGDGKYVSKNGEKYFLDLASANKCQAMFCGIPEENIWVSRECTYCNPDKYYSYRYANGTTGRQAGFIGML